MANESPIKLKIVEASALFETVAAARAWALANIRGRSATNKQTSMVIRVGRRSVEKTLSESAVLKSANDAAHLAAISVLLLLLEEAVLLKSHPDRGGDSNVRQIHRFYAALIFRGELYRVKLTIKESIHPIQGMGFYTYELAQIEMLTRKRADAYSEEQISAPHVSTINLTELLGGASVE